MIIKEKLKEWLDALLPAAVLLIILYFFLWPFKVDGDSMRESFRHDDRIIASRVMISFGMYKKGDIIVCGINRGGETTRIVKRLIGAPGDRVEIYDGQVYLNGQVLNEPYLWDQIGGTYGELDIFLKENEFFIMGDNRAVSLDSRTIGVISRNQMIGRVICRFYPFDQITLY